MFRTFFGYTVRFTVANGHSWEEGDTEQRRRDNFAEFFSANIFSKSH